MAASKTAKVAEDKSGMSKREAAIASKQAKVVQMDRRPKMELQYYYVRTAKGGLGLRKRKVAINQD